MSQSANPSEVLRRLMQGIVDRRWQELHNLYAEEAVVEYPFALPAPRRLEGREAIREYFAVAAGMPLNLQTRNFVVHETSDPEVVIAEWDYDGLVTTTGRAFGVANIQASRVRNGQIVASRDYHNHFVLAEVTGRLPQLLAALNSEESA
ncbi:MAG: nuclear transport factor 2 family protein [Dehalococcoidia bacterium]